MEDRSLTSDSNDMSTFKDRIDAQGAVGLVNNIKRIRETEMTITMGLTFLCGIFLCCAECVIVIISVVISYPTASFAAFLTPTS